MNAFIIYAQRNVLLFLRFFTAVCVGFGFSVFAPQVSSALISAQYSYDATNHLTQVTYSDGTVISYGYDAAGSLISESKVPPLMISAVTPLTAFAGDTVTITGSGFSGVVAVRFGGVPAASFVLVSPTEIRATVGNGASGNITVDTPSGTAFYSGFIHQSVVSLSHVSPGVRLSGAVPSQQLQVSAALSDGTVRDVTALASYTSSNPGVATVSAGGLITLVSPGTSTVSFSWRGVSGSVNVTAVLPVITGITPLTAFAGDAVTITGTNLAGVTRLNIGGVPVTGFTPVSGTQLTAVIPATSLSGAVSLSTADGTARSPGFTLLSVVSLSHVSPGVSLSGAIPSRQLQVSAALSDGTVRDVTALASYTSSNPGVATVSAGGLITLVSPGTSTVSFSWRGVSGSVNVTAVLPPAPPVVTPPPGTGGGGTPPPGTITTGGAENGEAVSGAGSQELNREEGDDSDKDDDNHRKDKKKKKERKKHDKEEDDQ